MRSMLPSMYTTYWFQSMVVGGDNPAPSAVAPRLMDCILLDGHLGVIFQFGLALLKSHEKEVSLTDCIPHQLLIASLISCSRVTRRSLTECVPDSHSLPP